MPSSFKDLIFIFIDLINTALPVIAGIGVLVFFWGLAKFIRNAGDAENHQDGKNLMIWGVIGFFVMVTVWGLVQFGQSSLGIRQVPFGIPLLPTNTNSGQSGYCKFPNGIIASGYSPKQCSDAGSTWSITSPN